MSPYSGSLAREEAPTIVVASPPMRRALLMSSLLVASFVARVAFADAAPDDAKAAARAKYTEGYALVKAAQWSDALATFEAAEKLYPAPLITLSIGACERALGRYVQARRTLARALAESAASEAPLPESSVVEAKGFLAEIDRVLATVQVKIDPPEAAIAIDGRPLAVESKPGEATVLAAGVLAPGPGTAPPAASFTLVLDPGAHVITLSRKGFSDAVVNKTFGPGTKSSLDLKLDLLPATLKITSTERGSLVRVDDVDVGPTPVDVLRPAGAYRVEVKHAGFVPYSSQVTLRPGEEVKINAPLAVEKPSIFTRWWFWTGAVVVVGAGATITYFATRRAPEPPPYDGGSTGWVAQPSRYALRF